MEVKADISQLDILEDFFSDLSVIDQRKVFISSFRRAVRPLVNMARVTVPKRTGNLMRSIGTVEVPKEIAIIVGTKTTGLHKGWYGHLMEGGTVQRFRKKKRGPTGKVIGTKFMERAYNSTSEQVFQAISDDWHNEIDRFIVKTNKRLR